MEKRPRVVKGTRVSQTPTRSPQTSWGKEASWYRDHLEADDTYHAKVILPNLMRMVGPNKGMHILEIGCGEGYFARAFVEQGATVTACDISPELIRLGEEKGGGPAYKVSPAENLSWANPRTYDVVVAVLTLQNMEKIEPVFAEVARVLKEDGRVICVPNHPVFRIPKVSAWGYDDAAKTQYRRIDAYLSARRAEMDMHPGRTGEKSVTYSFHRSLQDYMKAIRAAGLGIVRLEEWISHKVSEPGPRAKAENTARKEFPLFMTIECMLQK